MFFYFINLLLGAFVSYYSNPNLRINFVRFIINNNNNKIYNRIMITKMMIN